MFKNKLNGMGVALITPFKEDESVDYTALRTLVDFQINNGTDYLVVLGTTDETPTLTEQEKEKSGETVVEENNGRRDIISGMGGNKRKAEREKMQNTD